MTTKTRSSRRLVGTALFALAVLTAGRAWAQDIADTVVLGIHSVHLQQSADVLSGDVVANTISSGATQGCSGRELCVGTSTTTPAGFAIRGDSIQIKLGSIVNGDAFYNDLTDNSTGSFWGLKQPRLPCLLSIPCLLL